MKQVSFLIIISLLMALEFFYLGQSISKFPLQQSNLFLGDILGLNLTLPKILIIFTSVLNTFLLFYLTRQLFSTRVAGISTFLYSTSPWIIYLSFAGETAIFWSFLLLLQWIGYVKREKILGQVLFFFASLCLFISSVLFWPYLLVMMWYFWQVSGPKLRIGWGAILLVMGGFLAFSLAHFLALKNILDSQITFFHDVGLLNTVNKFQGETHANNLFFLGRLVENKYLYLLSHLFFNFLSALSLVTYFSPQYKLLNFSFIPPIFFSLVIPLIVYIKFCKRLFLKKFILIFLALLIMPAVLVQNAPDLNRLVVAAPIILILIGLGTEKLFSSKGILSRLLLYLTLGLFIFQLLMTMADISNREPVRLERSRVTQ